MSKAIQHRFQRVFDIGCICCLKKGWASPCQAHHLNLSGNAGQKQLGDLSVIGLCPWHHQGYPIRGMNQALCTKMIGPSLAHNSRAFRETFGSDEELLATQNRLIEEWDAMARGVKRA